MFNAEVERDAITAELAARLVAEQFPRWAQLPVTPVERGGWDNVTFRLGDELSLRLPSADGYAAQVEKEHRWLPFLAPQLPLPIAEPVARGEPSSVFPRPWSVYRWLPGEPAAIASAVDQVHLAADLADVLLALYAIDPAGGPAPGAHNFLRGAPPAAYDAETRAAIAALAGRIDSTAATEVWEAAVTSTRPADPVWIHGDMAPSNLLVLDGRLSGVIDFGCSAVGDPACDLTIAWTFFSGESSEIFRNRLALDAETWARGRGWALWKALITLARDREPERSARRFGWRLRAEEVVEQVLADHGRAA